MWGQGWDLGLLWDALGRGSLLTCTKKMGRQGVGGSRFWGEEEVAGRRGAGERKTVLWL